MFSACNTSSDAQPDEGGGPVTENKLYGLSDAIEVLGVKGELVLRALTLLPALRARANRWTVEDLAQINDVIKTQIVPQMPKGKGAL